MKLQVYSLVDIEAKMERFHFILLENWSNTFKIARSWNTVRAIVVRLFLFKGRQYDNATMRWRQCDNTTTTVRQYDDDNATIRWRQYGSVKGQSTCLDRSGYVDLYFRDLACLSAPFNIYFWRLDALNAACSIEFCRQVCYFKSHK